MVTTLMSAMDRFPALAVLNQPGGANELLSRRLHQPYSDVPEVFYDRDDDTLLVFLFGRDQPTIVHVIGDDVFALADADSHEIVGLQVESLLTRASREHPDLLAFLDLPGSRLSGITAEELTTIRRGTPSR